MGATAESDGDPGAGAPSERRGTRELVRQSLLSGVAIIVPLLVTLAGDGSTDGAGSTDDGVAAGPADDSWAAAPAEGDDSTTGDRQGGES